MEVPHIFKLNQQKEVKLKNHRTELYKEQTEPNKKKLKGKVLKMIAGKIRTAEPKKLKNIKQQEQLKEKEGRRRECS